MTLHPNEFIRLILLHVLPKRFNRIRHYGLFANGDRASTGPVRSVRPLSSTLGASTSPFPNSSRKMTIRSRRAINAALQSEYVRLSGISPAKLTAAMQPYLPPLRLRPPPAAAGHPCPARAADPAHRSGPGLGGRIFCRSGL